MRVCACGLPRVSAETWKERCILEDDIDPTFCSPDVGLTGVSIWACGQPG